jgi:hypothetical protein
MDWQFDLLINCMVRSVLLFVKCSGSQDCTDNRMNLYMWSTEFLEPSPPALGASGGYRQLEYITPPIKKLSVGLVE